MGAEKNVIDFENIMENKKVDAAINQQMKKKSDMYAGDMKRFNDYCQQTNKAITFDSLEKYLFYTITEQKLKLSTFNRRCAGVTYFLINEYGLTQTEKQKQRINVIRDMYNNEEYKDGKQMEGKSALAHGEVMDRINELAIRERAICLLSLVTASRPSELIQLQVKHINLDNRTMNVWLQKQGKWHTKRLTKECVDTLRAYFKEYQLESEHFVVCKTERKQIVRNESISDTALRKMMKKHLDGLTPYNLRKTQATHMYNNSNDLALVSEQTGHKDLQTLRTHYVEVDKTRLDKYL